MEPLGIAGVRAEPSFHHVGVRRMFALRCGIRFGPLSTPGNVRSLLRVRFLILLRRDGIEGAQMFRHFVRNI